MKKIVYIVSTLKKSGPTNQLFNIINNLDRSIFEPYLITLSPEPENSRWGDYEALDVKLISLNLSRLQGVFSAKNKLSTLIRKIQPNLIHTQGFRADVLSASLNIDLPKIATVRNFPQVDFVMAYGKLVGGWMVGRQIQSLNQLDRTIGVSNAVVKNLKNLYEVNNTSVVQNGVDTLIYSPVDEIEKKALRRKLKLDESKKIWIVSGTLIDRKDPLFLIDIWMKQKAICTDNLLVFIGGGDLLHICVAKIKDEQNIKIVGDISNVVDYIRAADFYLSSSKAEGLPNAAIEAMACGLPGLLSDIEPHKEIHAMSPDIGYLYILNDKESFVSAFEALTQANYLKYSKAALELVENELSAQIMSRKYQSIYKELLV